VRCLAKPGDYVRQGQGILELRADDPARFARALEALDAADVITIGREPPPHVPLVVDDMGA
jgi:thymidine phosphorylase